MNSNYLKKNTYSKVYNLEILFLNRFGSCLKYIRHFKTINWCDRWTNTEGKGYRRYPHFALEIVSKRAILLETNYK